MNDILICHCENLRCCGNCKKLITYDDSGDVIDECDRMESPSYLCIDWEYDGLTAEDRKI